MAVETSVVFSNLRCAPFHSALDVDPIGSGGNYDAYLCVEVPLPWERDISGNQPFAGLCDGPVAALHGADGRKWRPQGLVPPDGRGGSVQVVAFEQPDRARTGRSGTRFRRREWLVREGLESSLCAGLLAADDGVIGRFDEFEVPRESAPGAEVFVCTHGQRDVCCGGSGTSLHMDLLRRVAEAEDGALSVRRVSHTGGHRFAPTALTFPDGYAWSHLDPSLAMAIATRSVEPSEVLGHIRGSTIFKGGPAQAADRYGLGRVGWDWADAMRTVELIGFDRKTMATDVRVSGEMSNGPPRTFELRVGIERHIPQITCGEIDSPEYKVEPVWQVEVAREL